MKHIKLTDLLMEMTSLRENLPPGFNMDDFETIGEFTGETLMEDDEKFMGATTTDFPDAVVKQRFQQVADKTANATDKYKYPYIHRSNIIDDNGKPIDPEILKQKIKERPKTILKQNTKMLKSGKEIKFYDISLPAFKGLIVDETTNEFKIVDTCPGAGACRVYCYAKKGGYVQWKASSLTQSRTLNFLLNDWVGFKAQILSELGTRNRGKSAGKIVLRWHDSGEFLSPKYLELAYDIARVTPDVLHYAYTKMIGMVSKSNKPDNFVFNYSQGAIAPEEKLINPKIHKHSVVVPKQVFQDLITKDENGNWMPKTPEDEVRLKEKMSLKYNIPIKSILTYDEMMAVPEDPNRTEKFNILVGSGNGDNAATRKDVLGTYLFLHN